MAKKKLKTKNAQYKMPRRKTNEVAEYEVTVKGGPAGSQVSKQSKTVSATSAEQAMDAAVEPGANADEVTVTKKDPRAAQAAGQPSKGVVPEGKSKPRLSMKALSEAVDYPYTLFLPVQFRSLLEKLEIPTTELGNGLMVRFENKTKFTEALRQLNRTESPKAGIILNGIMESVK